MDSKLLFSGTILYHCEIQFCILSPNIYQTEGIWHKMRSRCSWCGVACVFSASVEVFSFRLVQFLAFLDYLSISIITHTHTISHPLTQFASGGWGTQSYLRAATLNLNNNNLAKGFRQWVATIIWETIIHLWSNLKKKKWIMYVIVLFMQGVTWHGHF